MTFESLPKIGRKELEGGRLCSACVPGSHSNGLNFVVLMQILRKPDGSSRGFGFVTYSEEKAVEQCLVMQHEIGGKAVCAQVL